MSVDVRILVAGIGNIFLGDDAFGVHVTQKLLQRNWPENVRVEDFGIRGLDLAYALLDCDIAILIDAIPRGERPGTRFVIEPQLSDFTNENRIEAHSMDPVKVLATAKSMGGKVQRLLVVGCEPTPIDLQKDMQMELSAPVAAAIEPVAEMVESLVEQLNTQFLHTEDQHAHANIGSNS